MNLHKHHPRNNKKAGRLTSSAVCHPSKPRKGDSYYVQTPDSFMGENSTITRVNRRSFYVYHSGIMLGPGRIVRRLVVEWEQWIDELFELGFVFLNGTPVLPRPGLTPVPVYEPAGVARQRRLNQAMSGARELLRRASVGEPAHSRKERRFKVVSGSGSSSTVTIPDDQKKRVTCSCAAHEAGGLTSRYPCRHIFAVLLSRDDLKHRILEYLL